MWQHPQKYHPIPPERQQAIGHYLTARKEELGLTNAQLSRASGVDPSTLTRALRNPCSAFWYNTSRIANALGIDQNELFKMAFGPTPNQEPAP